jgi:hypothetical protein
MNRSEHPISGSVNLAITCQCKKPLISQAVNFANRSRGLNDASTFLGLTPRCLQVRLNACNEELQSVLEAL